MKYRDRNGNNKFIETKQDKFLKVIYSNTWGRILIKPFTHPFVSKIGSSILNTNLSRIAIPLFIKSNHIDMGQYETKKYQSYNEFFCRKIKSECRPINQNPEVLISPSDGKVSVYTIEESSRFYIKNTWYTVRQLIQDKKLANKYKGGYAVVIRLTVDDYHRYCYPADGVKTNNRKIKGILHTVNPIANDYLPIYKENAREYTLIRTKRFGSIIQMEVGALLVGKIINYHEKSCIKKGMEKGRFEFGGSTIVLLLEKNSIKISDDLLENTNNGYETIIKMGEEIGRSYDYIVE